MESGTNSGSSIDQLTIPTREPDIKRSKSFDIARQFVDAKTKVKDAKERKKRGKAVPKATLNDLKKEIEMVRISCSFEIQLIPIKYS